MRFRDWLTALSGLAAVAFAIFAVGGVLRWTQAVVALLVAVSLVGVLVSRRALGRPSPLVVMLGIAIALCAIQLIPLGGLAAALAPMQSALRDDGAALLNLSPPQTLSMDTPGTLTALIFFATLLGIAVIALRMSTSERGRYRIIASVGALCGLVALTVGIHHLFGLRALYGLYTPEYAQPRLLGPLLNTNSLGCLMAVGAVIGIGLAAYSRQKSWIRVAWLLVVAGCGAITVSVISRGATLALVAGSFVTVAVLVAQRLAGQETNKRRRMRFMTSALPFGVLAGCMVVLVIYMNAGNVERQLAQLSFQEVQDRSSKFAAWQSSLTLVEEAPWFGVGRGAFWSSFTRVHPASGAATYSHLENEYLQAVVDWGAPGAVLLACAFIWFTWMALRRWRDGALTAAAFGAVTVVAMQSMVDFGVEFLGIAAPITAVAATLAYVPLRESRRRRFGLAIRGVHILALVIGAGLLLSSVTTSIEEDHLQLSRRPVSLAAIEESLERHPLDYYGYALAAETLQASDDPRAIRLLNHAMTLHPTHPGLHLMAARMLYRYRDKYAAQSTIEYGAALRATANPTKLVSEILARFSPEQAATALPVDFAHPHMILQALSDLGRPDVARLWLIRVLQQRPKDSYACETLYAMALSSADLVAAEAAGRSCVDLMPDYQTRLALAQVLARKQAYGEILRLLDDIETWETRVDDKITAWFVLCDAHAGLEHFDEAKRCLRRLDASPDMRAERRGELLNKLEALQKPGVPVPAAGSAATGSAARSP
jgi:O-antigen ligase